ASARLAKTTVSQSQIVVSQANTVGCTIARTVVKTEPTSTMNMTGLRHSVLGSSLRSASGVDFPNCFGSSSPPATRRRGGGAPARCAKVVTDIAFPRRGSRASTWAGPVGQPSVQAFGQRAEGEGGQEGQGHQDERDADQHPDEQGLVGAQRAGGLRDRL